MDTINLVKKLVGIPSVFPHEEEVSEYISNYLEKAGFDVKKVITEKNRPSIVATYGKSKKYLGFYGHLDTVPPEESVKNPFTVKIDGNKAYGLGTEDMKGGIAAVLKMGEYAVANKYPVKLIFGVDEENISQGAHDLIDSGLLNDISFFIVAESGQVRDITKPFNVCYGRNGRILFELDVFGKKSHAAESEKGINAVEKAAQVIAMMKKIKFLKHDRLHDTKIVIHTIKSETDSFSVPDRCRITFSLLTTPNVNSEKFRKKIMSVAKKKGIKITIQPAKRKTPYCESYEVDIKNPFLKTLESKIFEKYNVKPIYTPSVADENILANRLNIPVVSIGPIGGGGHTKDEWLDLKSLEIVESVYKQILQLR